MAMIAYFSEIDNSISENGIDNNGKIFNKKTARQKYAAALSLFFYACFFAAFLVRQTKAAAEAIINRNAAACDMPSLPGIR